MKSCGRCKAEKPLSEFWLDRKRGTPKSHCKKCSVASTKAWVARNPDYEKTRYAGQRVETRERHLVRKYGVTLETYDKMLKAQGGLCAICKATEAGQYKAVFHVDHCHATGRVRGLLCRGCNHILGHVKDDPETLRRAIAYLHVPQIPEMIGRAILSATQKEGAGITP